MINSLAKPAVILPLAFYFLCLPGCLQASPASSLWGGDEQQENYTQSGFYSTYTHELWSDTSSINSGGYAHREVIYSQFSIADQIDFNFQLGKQATSYNFINNEPGNVNWASKDTKNIWLLNANFLWFDLTLSDTLFHQQKKLTVKFNDSISVSYDRDQYRYYNSFYGIYPSDSSEIFIDIPQNIQIDWRKVGLYFETPHAEFSWQTNLSDNTPDHEVKNRWSQSRALIKQSNYDISVDYEFIQYPILRQPIFYDGGINGSAHGEISYQFIKLALQKAGNSYELSHINSKLMDTALFNAQILSDSILNPLLGLGEYDVSVDLDITTFIVVNNENYNKGSWKFGYGLGYLESDGGNKTTLFANPFGVLKRTSDQIDLKSSIWAIVQLGYEWNFKNISIRYQYDQLLPVKVSYRNESASAQSSTTGSQGESSLKWPLPGSRQTFSLSYLF